MTGKHDLNHAVQQLDAGALGGHRCVWVLQIPASRCSAEKASSSLVLLRALFLLSLLPLLLHVLWFLWSFM